MCARIAARSNAAAERDSRARPAPTIVPDRRPTCRSPRTSPGWSTRRVRRSAASTSCVTNTGGPKSGPFESLTDADWSRADRLDAAEHRAAVPRCHSAHAAPRRRPHHQHHVDLGEAADRRAGAVERAAGRRDGLSRRWRTNSPATASSSTAWRPATREPTAWSNSPRPAAAPRGHDARAPCSGAPRRRSRSSASGRPANSATWSRSCVLGACVLTSRARRIQRLMEASSGACSSGRPGSDTCRSGQWTFAVPVRSPARVAHRTCGAGGSSSTSGSDT